MPPSLGRIVDATDDLIKRLGGKPIRAYHGSPYDFDRFDASKIGTGEGAQAYGHGLYFAGNEGVARSYRDITPAELPPEAAELSQQLKGLFKQHSDLTGELHMAADTDGTFAVGWGNIKDPPQVAKAKILPQLAAVNRQLQDVQTKLHNVLHNRRGHMYEVQIAHPEETLLDWDAPMASQSQYVQERLAAIDPKQFGLVPDEMPGPYGGLRWRTQRNTVMGTPVQGKSPDDLTFWDTHRDNRSARTAYADLSAMTQGTASASQALRQAGIPGIRYLDQGSRAAGDGTRNYVMFPGTEDSITILRKYGLLPPLAGAAAMQGDQ